MFFFDKKKFSKISAEHTFGVISHLHFVTFCEPEKDPLAESIKINVPYLYNKSDHISVLEAFFAYFINTVVTCIWNYLDVFIMMIGMALTTQFKLFNDELKRVKGVVVQFICFI